MQQLLKKMMFQMGSSSSHIAFSASTMSSTSNSFSGIISHSHTTPWIISGRVQRPTGKVQVVVRTMTCQIFDSGATDHMTWAINQFFSYIPCSGKEKVLVANESFSSIFEKEPGQETIVESKPLESSLDKEDVDLECLDLPIAIRKDESSQEKSYLGTYFSSTQEKARRCKWIYRVKQNTYGTVNRYKTRLVARGYTQTHGIDYQETFAPIAKMNIVRVFISCEVNSGWDLEQLDVKNAFFHGELKEEIYMDIPPGFTYGSTTGKFYHLHRSLYGLKQSPRAWFGRFRKAMRFQVHQESNADHTLSIKQNGNSVIFLIVYVANIMMTGNDVAEMTRLKGTLPKEFEF
ncbi:Retrovirus-related Pol polyprotein from transposon RE2-like protein [Drosera capensis]